MCTANPVSSFPPPDDGIQIDDPLAALYFGSEDARSSVAILPDIYGCNAFYRSLATHLAKKGFGVFLLNPFHEFGELSEPTREAAFERRNKIKDRAYVDDLEQFLVQRRVGGVVGFCLGGLYVFDLVRRELPANLVAVYPFPQGLANQDPLAVPFDYLPDVTTPHTVVIGDQDHLLGPENIVRLRQISRRNSAMTLHEFKGSGHGFLADLDEKDPVRRDNAVRAMAILEQAIASGSSASRATP